ncbi:MAG TPA: 16S rRNA (cytosine(967)-C(5))-methyltransferase RsmB, partial [Erysipelotrichaceae bacterium]|nr:16S rRNA (cytosine(967)-C(5))-methyltransferase RsmB [Erysipelotrichaceae bacterium]
LARKPEIKYHDSSAMDEIIPLQAKLLENAYYLLKNGGKMVYSTCTLNKKENEKQ